LPPDIDAGHFRRTFQFPNALFLPDIPIPKLTGHLDIGNSGIKFRRHFGGYSITGPQHDMTL
jgi:hypothetical protein